MRNRLLALLVVLPLFAAQWSGLSHRIEHSAFAANLQVLRALQGHAAERTSSSHAHGESANHPAGSAICVLFDACVLGDVVSLTVSVVVPFLKAQSLFAGYASARAALRALRARVRDPPNHL